MHFIADAAVFSSHLKDQSGARGQAIGLLGQTLARRVFEGGYGEAFIALGATLFVAVCVALLLKYEAGLWPAPSNVPRSPSNPLDGR
jgi:hypothetical protein